jgi:dipeptidase D
MIGRSGKREDRVVGPTETERPAVAAADDAVLDGLEPAAFWRRFGELSKIARPSRNEELAAAWVKDWAADRGYEVAADEIGNLVVRVPATPGREGAATVVLQGHLDMVCERQPGSPYDPVEGRIHLLREGEWLTADGTTLGADDGVAIAAMIALVDDADIPHGPLELLMTVREEVGLEGVQSLDGSMVTGAVLVNLDSEEDGKLTVGCAGSTDTWLRVEQPREPVAADDVALTVTVAGGKGGHSGQNIAQGHSNALKVLGRALREAHAAVPFRLASFAGGKSRNAIPRDAAATVVVQAGRGDEVRAAVEKAAGTIGDAYRVTDPGVEVTVAAAAAVEDAWTVDGTARLLDAVSLVPYGPLSLSSEFDGLVELSTSLGEAATDGERLTLHSLTRSSNGPLLDDVMATLDSAARLAGGRLEVKHNYGAWRPNLDSAVLKTAVRVYERVLGEQPIVTAVHAGLESAVIGGKMAAMPDMISFGPQIEFPHSPDERVSIPTVERFWKLLVGLVDELSSPNGARA